MFKFLRIIGAVAIVGALAACGGSAGGPAAVSQPQGTATVVSGTITGFGSVVIDGVEYPEGQVAVARDVDGRSEAATTMASVKVGQQVEASLDEQGRVVKLLVRATARGPVESIDSTGSSFKVAGQTVVVVASGDGATMFEGVAGLAALTVGTWVEVHGTLDASGNIVATRVEVEAAGGEIKLRVAGLVKDLSDTAKTFKLGDVTVEFGGASIKPDGSAITNDVLVFVYSDQLPVSNTITAKVVRLAKKPSAEARTFHIGGPVADASADGRTFRVNGIRIDASSAELKGGQRPVWTDVQNMKLARVEGSFGADAAGPLLKATRVWLVPASEQRRVLLIGQITDVASPTNFKVRGTPVDAATATVKNGVKADLKEGAFVEVKGRIDGDTVKADEITMRTPPKDLTFRLFGTVSQFNATDKTFKLLGIPMQLAAAASFTGGTLADFGDGDVVNVKGSFNGAQFVVTEVQFKSSATLPLVHLEGIASAVSSTSMTVSGAAIKITATTQIADGPLANGQHVEVTAQWLAGELVALKIEIDAPGARASLRGPISDFVTRADFKVNGQRVDAGTATLKGGSEAQLANGVLVRIKGALAGGVVKATEVEFLR